MKRLRLKKIWVIVAIFMLMIPFVWGRLQPSEAATTTPTTAAPTPTPTPPPLSGQLKLWLSVSGGGGAQDFVDPDGLSRIQWNMKVAEDSGFVNPNTGYVTAMISVDGVTEANLNEVCDHVEWEYKIETTNADRIISVTDFSGGGATDTKKILQISPKAAGLISVWIRVTGYDSLGNESGLNISRRIIIGSPLQIYSEKTSIPARYTLLKSNNFHGSTDAQAFPTEKEIYANNANIESCNIQWFYIDAKTNELLQLQNPTYSSDDVLPTASNIIQIGEKGAETSTDSGVTILPYRVTAGNYGGITRLVGRIYLDGQSTNNIYVEQTFDVIVAASITEDEVTLKYGENIEFAGKFSNDVKNSLEWKAFSTYPTTEDTNKTLEFKNGVGFTANNFGEIILEATSLYKGWEFYDLIGDKVKDTIKVKVESAVLKGTSTKKRIDSTEVISVGGTIALSTNVIGDQYTYKWYLVDGSTTSTPIQDAASEFYTISESISAGNGSLSSITIRGKKSGQFDVRCVVFTTDENNPVLDQTFTIKVTDTLSLSEAKKTIAVGQSFSLDAYTSVATGNVEWTIAEADQEFLQIETTSNRTAKITGLKPTDNRFITITATLEMDGTTVSATCQVKVIPAISEVTIIADPSDTIPKGGITKLTLEFADGNTPNYTSDQIKWVLKDKNGVAADTIINLEASENTPMMATVTGLEVGEAYVAVVTNDSAETEIAVITIRVVSEPVGLELSEHEVLGYLSDQQYQLEYTILPKGFVSGELEVEWTSSNENIATVDRNGVVTYHAIGTVRITANIVGLPALADFCTFTIENPATGLTFNPTEKNIKVGEKFTIEATITPDDVTDRTIVFSSSNTAVATVDPNTGEVTGVGSGGAIITGKTKNGLEATCVVTVLKPAASITLNYTEITVKKGTVFFLSAKVEPEDTYNKEVIWTSSDDSIVQVDPDGTVTALATGEATITATSVENSELTATCVVTVTESMNGISLNVREQTIYKGEKFLLVPIFRPSDASNREVTWSSSDSSVATVDEKGLVTGIKGGKAIITVTTTDRGLMASCIITVQEDITGITLSDTELTLGKGLDKQIIATITPESATNKRLRWESSNPGIVLVDSNGNIHGVNLGTATITAYSTDGSEMSASCKVTVIEQITEIKINPELVRMMQTEKYQLTYTLTPANATKQRVKWTTSDASVAKVDSYGLVTAIGEGECTITATADDGSGIKAECTIVVSPFITTTNLRINSVNTVMLVGDKRALSVRAYPTNTNEGTKWESSDTSIARVDENGNVTAVGPGECQIRAYTTTSGLESECTITVLGLNATSINLEQYDTYDLYLDGIANGVTWFSRNKRVATVTANGKVTGRRPGTTTIVARINGKLVSCEVVVEAMPKFGSK